MRITSNRGGDDQAADDLRAYGSSEDEIREALGNQEPEAFAVWQDNAETVDMFMSLQTQWRVGPMGGYLGLDYAGVVAALDTVIRAPRRRRGIFLGLQAMERAALPVLNARHD